jgi:hypothetical protein
MSDARKIAGRTVARATTDKRPQVTVGMSIQQESILYCRAGRQSRRYY